MRVLDLHISSYIPDMFLASLILRLSIGLTYLICLIANNDILIPFYNYMK